MAAALEGTVTRLKSIKTPDSRASAIRTGMTVAGILCLAGLLGVLTADMQVRNFGIAGYGSVFPVVTLLMAHVFGSRPRPAGK